MYNQDDPFVPFFLFYKHQQWPPSVVGQEEPGELMTDHDALCWLLLNDADVSAAC